VPAVEAICKLYLDHHDVQPVRNFELKQDVDSGLIRQMIRWFGRRELNLGSSQSDDVRSPEEPAEDSDQPIGIGTKNPNEVEG
jgi:hypothetical protein